MERLFTSESVTAGHPDKVCDQISDAILDACLSQDSDSRVACETAINTDFVLVMGEITTKAIIDIPSIVRKTVQEIGYETAEDILLALQIEVVTVFPIINTYERMLLTQQSDGTIKSIYK